MADLDGEIWKRIFEFPDYEVSNLGRVKSHRNWKSRILRSWTDAKGYLYVELRDSLCQVYGKRISRLVAEAFIGPAPTIGHQVNHKDGNKQNNQSTNLEWVTNSENIRHADRTGLRKKHGFGRYSAPGSLNAMSKLRAEDVLRIRQLAATGMPNLHIAKEYGLSPSAVGMIVNRQRWTHI